MRTARKTPAKTYYIRRDTRLLPGKKWQKIATPCTLFSHRGICLIAHRHLGRDSDWQISCYTTGCLFFGGWWDEPKTKLIDRAKRFIDQNFDRVQQTVARFAKDFGIAPHVARKP